MPASLSDWLLSLAFPAVMCASGIYAGISHLRGRRNRERGIAPHGVPPVFVRRQALEERIVRHQMVAKAADRIVVDELARVASLYEEPTQRPAHH